MVEGAFIHHSGMQGMTSCTCGKTLRDETFKFSNGFLTNCFALHWLTYRRDEIPLAVLQTIKQFKYGEKYPAKD